MKYVHKDTTTVFTIGQRIFIALMNDDPVDGRMFTYPCIINSIVGDSLYVTTESSNRESFEVDIEDRNITLSYDECRYICDRYNADWISKKMDDRRNKS